MAEILIKNCEHCGKEYQATYKKQRYCNKVCSGTARGSKKYKVSYCPICENKFVPGRNGKRFCSHACAMKAQESHIRCVCRACSKKFKPKQSDRTEFCSRECFFKAFGKIAKERAFLRKLHLESKRRKKLKIRGVVCQKEFNSLNWIFNFFLLLLSR